MREQSGGASRRSRRPHGESRAQSELVGVVLLVALVVTGSLLVGMLGRNSLHHNEKAVAVDYATQSLTQLDARASDVAFGFDGGTAQSVPLDVTRDRGTLTTESDSWINVSFLNTTTGKTAVPVVNQSLGTVVYRVDDTTVAYEGGGVWRSDGNGSVMVSAPEFAYRNQTLTIPIPALSGDRGLQRRVTVERNGPTQRVFPDASKSSKLWTNQLNDVRATVTVHSRYYRAWGQYFERTTHSLVEYDDAKETATVTFLALPKYIRIKNGIMATAGNGLLDLHGNGAYTDSYDSRNGTYAVTKNANGTVEAVGNVYMGGSSQICGTLRSGGHINLSGSPNITGDAFYTKAPEPDPSKVAGIVKPIDGVQTLEPIDSYVFKRVDDLRANNTNGNAGSVIKKGNITTQGNKVYTLGSGRYYVNSVDVGPGKLVFDTTNGDIDIAVRDWIRVHKGGNITVKGNGTVHVYMASQGETPVAGGGTGGDNISAANLYLNAKNGAGASVHTPGQNATQLQVFAPRGFRAAFAGNKGNNKNVSFDGLIYAPAGRDGSGKVYVKHGDVYGGVITGSLTLGQYGAVHYDKALSDLKLPRATGVARLRYLHVSIHRIKVENQ